MCWNLSTLPHLSGQSNVNVSCTSEAGQVQERGSLELFWFLPRYTAYKDNEATTVGFLSNSKKARRKMNYSYQWSQKVSEVRLWRTHKSASEKRVSFKHDQTGLLAGPLMMASAFLVPASLPHPYYREYGSEERGEEVMKRDRVIISSRWAGSLIALPREQLASYSSLLVGFLRGFRPQSSGPPNWRELFKSLNGPSQVPLTRYQVREHAPLLLPCGKRSHSVIFWKFCEEESSQNVLPWPVSVLTCFRASNWFLTNVTFEFHTIVP